MKTTKILLVAVLVISVTALFVSISTFKTETVYKKILPEYGDFKVLSAQTNAEVKNTIDVTGTYTSYADPDKVEIYLGAQTDSTDASDSQQQNAVILQKIRSGLASKGISSTSIQTTQYSLEKITEWDEIRRINVDKGYRTTHILKIKLTDINKAGEIVDVAVENGANRVDSIVFGLSDSKAKTMRTQALTVAAKNSREKADAIASGLGISITKVNSASEGYVGVTPYYATKNLGGTMESAAVPTEISAGQIEISASVSVSYEFA
jgi:uncharacterized protein YggE